MPLLVTFDDRPVRYHCRREGGLLLTFVAPQIGAPGERRFVTHAEWRLRSRRVFYPAGLKPDVRALAAQAAVVV